MKTLFKIIITSTLLYSSLFSAATFTQGSSADELAAQIEGVGITITNPVITHGAKNQRGIFSNGIAGAGLQINEGILLTTMTVKKSFKKNSSPALSVNHKTKDKDKDLIGIDPNAYFNTIVFEFDVTLDENTRLLLIDYQFAAEEYNEYVGTKFNDAFGFFISGGDLPPGVTYNIARVVDNQTYVTINNINNYSTVAVNNVNNGRAGNRLNSGNKPPTAPDYSNTAFYINNDQNNHKGTSPVIVEYDGLTVTLHATLDNLKPNETYHFKMAIADASDAKLNTGVFVNKINGLREPSICYDYAYKQNGQYLTEAYNSTTGPYISGDVVANDPSLPIEVAMYFRNTKDSEIIASDITLDVVDINTSQATYKTESVSVIEPGTVFRRKIDDVDLNVSTSYVKEIPITSFDAYDYFYTYFSLNPKVKDLHLPINARINYDLTIPLSANHSITIPRSSAIDADVPICSNGGNSFDPVYGIFNIIENGLYTDNDHYYYNINTQVTNREANLSIVTIDANLTSNSDLHTILAGVTTVVGIDMLDLKSFHYTGASCSEIGNSITDRVWIPIKGTALTPLTTNKADFYKTARENVTMRVSYVVVGNDNELLELEEVVQGSETKWNVLNFSNSVQNGDCTGSFVHGNSKIAQNCTYASTNFSGAMTKQGLATCMECVYGTNTKLVCARDNFSIRPEAFLINLDDQNQTNPADPEQKITNNLSGVTSPSAARLNIAAGYQYNLDINATNHLNNAASQGYNFHMNTVVGTSSSLVWTPRSGQDVSGCNNTDDFNVTVKFVNGEALNDNISVSQIGDYIFSITDTAWTTIDSIQQSHHTGSYFKPGSDCIQNSTFVGTSSSYDNFTGCNISTTHTSSTDTNLVYVDLNLSIHPYKFSLDAIKPTLGTEDSNLSITATPAFIYMANMSRNNYQDQNMSFHLNGIIKAVGYNDNTLSNFVDKCYAKPLDLNVTKSDTTLVDNINGNAIVYQLNFNNLDENSAIILLDTQDINETDPTAPSIGLTTPAGYFTKALNGSMNTILNLNYDRNISIVANPKSITFDKYKVSCTVVADCTFNADYKNDKKSKGNLTIDGNGGLNGTVIHYYGRTNAPRQRFVTPVGTTALNPAIDFIYYEVYCSGVGCDKTLLQNGPTSMSTDDPRWFVNTNHKKGFGIAGNIFQKGFGAGARVSGTVTTGNHPDSTNLVYNASRGYPYKATMENNASTWLIYNRFDSNDKRNEFEVEFSNGASSWAGQHDTNTTTNRHGVSKTNRRSMW